MNEAGHVAGLAAAVRAIHAAELDNGIHIRIFAHIKALERKTQGCGRRLGKEGLTYTGRACEQEGCSGLIASLGGMRCDLGLEVPRNKRIDRMILTVNIGKQGLLDLSCLLDCIRKALLSQGFGSRGRIGDGNSAGALAKLIKRHGRRCAALDKTAILRSSVGLVLAVGFLFGNDVLLLIARSAGFLFGKATKWIFRVELEHNGLYFVASFSMILLCYSITQLLGANGFMACYVCGIILNSGRYNYQKTLNKFHNGVAWLMQVGLFTVLGFLASPKDLFNISVWLPGIILGFLLIFVARPLAVFICLFKSGYNIREKLMISWVGIRGAAPIVLATFPLAAGVEDAQLMFRLIFFMVILSVTLQGWLLMPAAKWLKVARTVEAQPEPAPLELEVTESTSHQEMREFQITANNPMNGKNLAEIALPTGVLVTMVRRDKKLFPPRGDTVLKAGDSVLIMAEIPLLAEVENKYFKTASTK